jgi:hypothetical protein
MKRSKPRVALLVAGAVVGSMALSTHPVQAQNATTMDVFGKAYQIFMFVAQNAYRLDTPDGKAAPCRDPWVSSAFRLVFQREPNASGDQGECNYRNFGGGVWSSYRDLVWKTAWYRAYKDLGLVRGGQPLDASQSTPEALQPMVTKAVAEVTGKAASTPNGKGEGYELIKDRVEDVYYSCADDDISRAVITVTGRAPRGSEYQGECNPLLYNNGKWSDYNDLAGKVRKTLVRDPYKVGECRESELTRAITEVKKLKNDPKPYPSGMGELGECNTYLYGYGHWSSYADLKLKVANALGELSAANIQLQPDNGIKAQRMERGGGSGALMALLAAANAYLQWKAAQPEKESNHNKNQNKHMMMQPGMQQPMQNGMQTGMMQPGMQQGGMMQPGMMPGMMQPQMQQGMSLIQPGAQMPMMPPQMPQQQMQQMPAMQGGMMQQPMQNGMQQPMMQQPMMQQPMQAPQMQPGMMPQMPAGM